MTPSRRTAFGMLAAATVVLGSLGIWAQAQASSLRSAAGANIAYTDQAATAATERAVARAVSQVFSYSYTDTARTRAIAQRLLTGTASSQYNQLFGLVEQQAPKQKLVVATSVTNVGVELLADGRARVLLFVTQRDTRAGTAQASYGGSMLAVTAVQRQGTWLIESIDTFTSAG